MPNFHTHLHSDRSPRVDLFVVGELNVDLILDQIQGLPELEKEKIASGMTLTLGSSSAILAANAASLGLKVAFVGRVGHDTFGSLCVDSLSMRGVDTTHIITTDGVQTGLTCIFTSGRKRGMLTYPGAMERLTISDITDEMLLESRHLHLSSYYLQSGLRADVARLFQRAKDLHLTTSFDTNWDPDDKWDTDIYDVLPFVDVFLPNDDEAMRISRKSTLDEALEFLSSMCGVVVATCGSKGIRARQSSKQFEIDGLSLNTVDAVGAGDTFNSGFLSKYIHGAPLEDCLRLGILSSAFSTQYAGGTAAFDHLDAFQAFIKQHDLTMRVHDTSIQTI